jgi:U3 small nucleolar ribonucleoprotein protein IMP3
MLVKLAPQSLKQFAHRLPPDSPFWHKDGTLLDKFNDMGILPSTSTTAKLSKVEKNVTVSAFWGSGY